MPRSGSLWWNGIFWRKPSIAEPGSEEDDDRSRSSTALDRAPVRAGVDRPLVVLPRAHAESAENLVLMRLIDEQFLESPGTARGRWRGICGATAGALGAIASAG